MDLGQIFHQESSRDKRNEALVDFVKSLDPYEFRQLQGQLQHETFQYDIIAGLPVEIVAQIFRYIDPVAIYQLQHISRTWYHKLSSPDVLQNSLRAWYGYRIPRPDVDQALLTTCREKVEQIKRFYTGKPYYKFSIDLHQADNDRLALSKDNLAWLALGSQAIHVRNLRNGHHKKLQCEARDTIVKFTLTDQVLAFHTKSKTCYVGMLDDGGGIRKFRLPVYQLFDFMHAHERKVICGGRVGTTTQLYIWDFDTQTGYSLTVDMNELPFSESRNDVEGSRRHEIALLIDASSQEFHMFASYPYDYGFIPTWSGTKTYIYHATYTLSGKQIAHGKCCFEDVLGFRFGPILPVDCNGKFALEAYGRYCGFESHPETRFRFEYDTVTRAFALDEQWPPWNVRHRSSAYNGVAFMAASIPYFPDQEIAICMGTRDRPKHDRLDGKAQVEGSKLETVRYSSDQMQVLINPTWAVHKLPLPSTGVMVFCYEKNVFVSRPGFVRNFSSL
ncbi:hypothetical protein BU24DRAFT_422466 [Aaosphaeria arxii CBS 175.79]|uniref:F-box domain-containing protein n=1 Tax=Aaosphaeria arxii CBS 175.79 TaxID=1450172 RepID=A0A6A5XTH7_9PLEO|nr:uncharacterized protein BU24DRAFT_422466 [Aaosphaeria arxii CBS 175.79]KAF2016127.1 hypothetical protein BU24DRAFT_422466 [Aaosphaeria arxii CBS 175.79]